jgi:hypothetical protein
LKNPIKIFGVLESGHVAKWWRLAALRFGKNHNSVIDNVPQMRGRDDIKKAFNVGVQNFWWGLLWSQKKSFL